MRCVSIRTVLAVLALFVGVCTQRGASARIFEMSGFAIENSDNNGDGDRDMSDGVYLLSYLYTGGPEPVPLARCVGGTEEPLNGDANADGVRDLSDAVQLLSWLFTAGAEPADACGPVGGHLGAFRPRVVPVQGKILGRLYEHLAIEWWRWVFGMPADQNPLFTSNCTVPQSGLVQFIAASFGAGTVTCDFPFGKGLFFPLSGFINDFPCPDPNFQPAPGQSLEDFLIETVQPFVALITNVELIIDGVSAGNMFRQRVTSGLFTFTGDTSLQGFDPCITGTPQEAIADGYYVLIVGLAPGLHTLHVKITFAGTDFEVINEVTVVR